MADNPIPLSPGPSPDPRRLRISQQLRKLVGPGPAAFYRDACDLMDSPSRWLSTSHLVGHLIREIESALRAVLSPIASNGRPISKTDKSDGNGHQQNIQTILAALGISTDDPVSQKWLGQAGTYQQQAHRRSLAEPIPVTEGFVQFFDDFEGILDHILNRMEANFAAIFVTLDQLAVKSPATDADVKFLLNSVPQDFVALGRFFETISDPSWLPVLRNAGVFSTPPEPEPGDDNTVSFPPWPPMRYLVRLAPVAPDVVASTVEEIPATDNIMVNAAIIDVARALPTARVVELLPRVIATLDARYRMAFPLRIAALVGELIALGDLGSAMTLAHALLAFEPPTKDDGVGGPSQGIARAMNEPRPRIDEHTYEEILKRHMPPLAAGLGQPVIEMLAELLEEAIVASASEQMEETGEDFSSTWRHAIMPEGPNHDLGLKSRLTTALRESIAARVSVVPEDLQPILVLLEARRWSIFRRLTFDLLARQPLQDHASVETRLTSREYFDDSQLRPEYNQLLTEHFGAVGKKAREAVLSMIGQGRNVDGYALRVGAVQGREPTADEVQAYIEEWQLERLSPIADQLPEDWKARYEGLLAVYGPPPSNTAAPGGGFFADRSPATAEELAALSIDELIDYLTSFEPSGDFFGPSKGGLATTLGELIAASPARYLAAGRRLGGLDVEYAHGFLNGVQRTVTGGGEVDWDQVLDLCEAVVAHPRPIAGGEDIDNGWGWARLDVMRLLSSGFTGPAPLTDEHRERVFSVIATVASDPHPSPSDEERYGPPNMSPDDLALNSVRPRAVDLAVQYGVWIYRRHPDDTFSEVTALVDDHLDPVLEPSVAVRSVLGSQFSNLIALDQDWAAGAADRIFLADEKYRNLWEAAWDAYLWRGLRNKSTWMALRAKYELAVSRMAPGSEDRRDQSRDHALANHLMNLYWAGELQLTEGLIPEFFDTADEETRRHALESIGRGLAEDGPPLDQPLADRLLALWESRVNAVSAHSSGELSAFGWWFCSSRLSATRRISGLRDALALSGGAEPAHMVVEQLAVLSTDLPRDAVELLAGMVAHEEDGWRLSLWDDSASTVIRNALACPDPETLRFAREASSRAAFRGHQSWVDLR
ncbi:MAG: hypothetical protein ABSB09_09075 [Acidimicrobiales bacterium]